LSVVGARFSSGTNSTIVPSAQPYFSLERSATARCNSGSAFGGDEAGVGGETLSGNPYARLWIGLQIPHPVGGRVFGDQEEASVAIGKPDLDFTGQTAGAASRGEIEILLAAETTDL
jgi:hypothetical protein